MDHEEIEALKALGLEGAERLTHARVYLIDLPPRVKGVTPKPNEEGYGAIFINSRLSFEEARRTLLHEAKHFINAERHFENVTQAEQEAIEAEGLF